MDAEDAFGAVEGVVDPKGKVLVGALAFSPPLLALGAPKLKLGAAVAGLPSPEPIWKPVDPDEGAPKENPAALGALEAGDVELAPPKESCGVEPPGPNLPNLLAGLEVDGLSMLAEGENEGAPGVEGCNGPEGANENRVEVGFLAGVADVEVPVDDGPKLKPEGAGLSDFGCSFSSSVLSLPSMTS